MRLRLVSLVKTSYFLAFVSFEFFVGELTTALLFVGELLTDLLFAGDLFFALLFCGFDALEGLLMTFLGEAAFFTFLTGFFF